jgi:predicted adenylyl cyclase CyaB
MPTNLEFKCRISSCEEAVLLLERNGLLEGSERLDLHQRDLFYFCPVGRLKLRLENETSAQLVYYRRVLKNGEGLSDYLVTNVEAWESLHQSLTAAYGLQGELIKWRQAFVTQEARFHFDQVEGLGSFFEIEAFLPDTNAKKRATALVRKVQALLDPDKTQILNLPYLDLKLQGEDVS